MNWLTLDLNLLRVLDAMLRERNTTRVGERIGLSQPAVSAALSRLRHLLGDPLFLRQGNVMVPTPLAARLEQPLQQALGQIERTLAGSAAFDPRQSTRRFRMLGDDFLAELLLPKLAARLARDAPGICFQLLPINPRPLGPQFIEGDLDLAFGVDQPFPDWIEQRFALLGSGVVVASKRNERLAGGHGKLTLDLYCEMPHVAFSPYGSLVSREDEALERIGRKRRVTLTVPDFFSVGRVVAQTQLLGDLPTPFALAIADQLGLNIYAYPFEPIAERLFVYWHKRYTDDAEHRWIRERIVELLDPLDAARQPIALRAAGGPRKKRSPEPDVPPRKRSKATTLRHMPED